MATQQLVPQLERTVQQYLARQALLFEHYFLNGTYACDWSPSRARCVVCSWHSPEALGI